MTSREPGPSRLSSAQGTPAQQGQGLKRKLENESPPAGRGSVRRSKRVRLSEGGKTSTHMSATIRNLLRRKLRVLRKFKRRVVNLALEESFLTLQGDFPNFNKYLEKHQNVASNVLHTKSFYFDSLEKLILDSLQEKGDTATPLLSHSAGKGGGEKESHSAGVKAENRASCSLTPSTSAVELKDLLPPSSPSSAAAEGSIERAARQEAAVLGRVTELRRQGLWSSAQLPICAVPARNKTHWDYVLEEMRWMAQDFEQERRFKRAAAKKFARDIVKLKRDEQEHIKKQDREKERNLKRIAAFMAKEVKQFWKNVEKVVDYKHQSVLDAHKKKAMDRHLDFLVGQTEKYSIAVKEGLTRTTTPSTATPSLTSKDDNDELEFTLDSDKEEEDDERTIAKAEKGLEKESVDQEVSELQKESEMDIDDILDDIPQEYLEYLRRQAAGETTKEAEGSDDEKEGSSSDSGTDEDEEEDVEGGGEESSKISSEMEEQQRGGQEAGQSGDVDFSKLNSQDSDERQQELAQIAEAAEQFQPKGFTLETTKVVTKIPFLLRHELREYQHVGLDWLVTLYNQNLNGILADEMGLGKTIQTIALLAHLACDKENWGPHLIVVPTTVILNWEMELKKWCPAFKILTYFGSQKERKEKRKGWSKPNAFHVCITSYKLVIQDHRAFRAKRWEYFVLDEAQNIKNFKSQRWQMLLNFNAHRRLLLTGTPLQNSLMELWSLMHFLMPHVFASHRDFKDWFSNPLTGMIQGSQDYNKEIVERLHKVLRPFILRRMKCEVEKQLPKKYQHVIQCQLSKRQRFLYDDFMSRGTTKNELSSGSVMSVLNILMQLRKCCNHPNLFEPRPVESPFAIHPLPLNVPSLVCDIVRESQSEKPRIPDVFNLNFDETKSSIRRRQELTQKKGNLLIEEVEPDDKFPAVAGFNFLGVKGKQGMLQRKNTSGGPTQPAFFLASRTNSVIDREKPVTVRFQGTNLSIPLKIASSSSNQHTYAATAPQLSSASRVNILSLVAKRSGGALSTAVIPEDSPDSGLVPPAPVAPDHPHQPPVSTRAPTSISQVIIHGKIPVSTKLPAGWHPIQKLSLPDKPPAGAVSTQVQNSIHSQPQRPLITVRELVPKKPQEVIRVDPAGSAKRPILPKPSAAAALAAQRGGWYPIERSAVGASANIARVVGPNNSNSDVPLSSGITATTHQSSSVPTPSTSTSGGITVSTHSVPPAASTPPPTKKIKIETPSTSTSSTPPPTHNNNSNNRHFSRKEDNTIPPQFKDEELEKRRVEWLHRRSDFMSQENRRRCCVSPPVFGSDLISKLGSIVEETNKLVVTNSQEWFDFVVQRFGMYVLGVYSDSPVLRVVNRGRVSGWEVEDEWLTQTGLRQLLPLLNKAEYTAIQNKRFSFPELRLIEYDCGKLHKLATLLRDLKTEGHRCLIFTQMSKMLDILEAFLCYHGYTYYRLDGSTKITDRQVLMERFNMDNKIFCFILSTRSGGIGVNLTGADTVIFYDSDWNPTIDAQAQDRCHRIGQTRDVHIYRLVSERTVEENVLRKAEEKRRLGEIAIENASFTAEFFKQSNIRELFDIDPAGEDTQTAAEPTVAEEESKSLPTIQTLEKCMATLEDDQDRAAAKALREEVVAEAREFDEQPSTSSDPQMAKVETEMGQLMGQLKPVERYAVRYLENIFQPDLEEELRMAAEEMEQKKKEWMEDHEAAMKEEEERMEEEEEEEFALTYFAHEDSHQVWLPPTPPPTDEELDLYVDPVLGFWYETDVMSERDLPPVYQKPPIRSPIKREREKEAAQRERNASSVAGSIMETINSVRQSVNKAALREKNTPSPATEPSGYTPRSLFDGGPSSKFRRDLRRPLTPPPAVLQEEQDEGRDWNILQDLVLLQAVTQGQQMAYNLLTANFGHAPNWDFVAERVNAVSAHSFFSSRQCSLRYQLVVLPREDGRLVTFDPISKKPRKIPITQQEMANVRKGRLKTGQQFQHDGKNLMTTMIINRFKALKNSIQKRCPPMKKSVASSYPSGKPNEVHSRALANCGVNYDGACNPSQMAELREQRDKERQKQQQLQWQQKQQLQQQQQAAQAAALDHAQLSRLATQPQANYTSGTPNTSSAISSSHNYSQQSRPQPVSGRLTGEGVSQLQTQVVSQIPLGFGGSSSRGQSPSVTIRSTAQPQTQISNIIPISQTQQQTSSQLPPGARLVAPTSVRSQLNAPSSNPTPPVATLYRHTSVSSGMKQRNTPPGTPLPTVGIVHQQSIPRTVIPVSTIGTLPQHSSGTAIRFPVGNRSKSIHIAPTQQLIGSGGTLLVSAESRAVMVQQHPSGSSNRIGVARNQLHSAMRKQLPKISNFSQGSATVRGNIQLIQYPSRAGGNPVQLHAIRQTPQRQSSVPVSSQSQQQGEVVGTIPSINVFMGSRNLSCTARTTSATTSAPTSHTATPTPPQPPTTS